MIQHTKKGVNSQMSIVPIARMTEDEARAYLEGIRWPDGPVCPHCQSTNATRLNGQAHRPGLIQCNGCQGQYTVTVGSVMEGTHLPLQKWVLAFHLLCSSKKGFSAKQLQRELELGSYQTAWHLAHRIREAMSNGPFAEVLQGTVEADESYVSGKPRKGDGNEHKRGRGTSKTPVVATVARESGAESKLLARVNAKRVDGFLWESE